MLLNWVAYPRPVCCYNRPSTHTDETYSLSVPWVRRYVLITYIVYLLNCWSYSHRCFFATKRIIVQRVIYHAVRFSGKCLRPVVATGRTGNTHPGNCFTVIDQVQLLRTPSFFYFLDRLPCLVRLFYNIFSCRPAFHRPNTT